jgi:hypothetical protein
VFEVDSNTVLQWLVEAAGQLTAYTRYFLCDVHVTQWQLDGLYAVLCNVKDGEISEDDASKRLERSPYWVWTVMDPESTLLLDIEMGTRTLARAQCVVHQVVQVLAPDCVPLCLMHSYQDYMMAFLSHFGYWLQPSRQRAYGPAPKPRWMPLPQRLYAQVVKSYRRRRIVAVKHRVVFGTTERVTHVFDWYGFC